MWSSELDVDRDEPGSGNCSDPLIELHGPADVVVHLEDVVFPFFRPFSTPPQSQDPRHSSAMPAVLLDRRGRIIRVYDLKGFFESDRGRKRFLKKNVAF